MSRESFRAGAREGKGVIVGCGIRNNSRVVEEGKLGVERSCRFLQVALSTFHSGRDRRLSDRVLNYAHISAELFDP